MSCSNLVLSIWAYDFLACNWKSCIQCNISNLHERVYNANAGLLQLFTMCAGCRRDRSHQFQFRVESCPWAHGPGISSPQKPQFRYLELLAFHSLIPFRSFDNPTPNDQPPFRLPGKSSQHQVSTFEKPLLFQLLFLRRRGLLLWCQENFAFGIITPNSNFQDLRELDLC